MWKSENVNKSERTVSHVTVFHKLRQDKNTKNKSCEKKTLKSDAEILQIKGNLFKNVFLWPPFSM